jgi:eukaryotic-like serine/threonine-protein kinase
VGLHQDPDPFGWVGHEIDGKYRIDRVIGEGGFGVVYQAYHAGLRESIAVKCLKVPSSLAGAQRAQFEETFLEEGRLLHRLSRMHAAIAQALDVGAATSPSGTWTPYLVLEWLEGRSLQEELDMRRADGAPGYSVADALELLGPALDALAEAHEQGIAHRDLKPPNLFLANVGGRIRTKVLDFGIAKVMGETMTLTRALEETGASIKAFTPQYGAPEQFDATHGATGPWTDVFALALIFVELITGRPALEGQDTIQLFVASANPQTRPTPGNRGVQVSPAMDQVLERGPAAGPLSLRGGVCLRAARRGAWGRAGPYPPRTADDACAGAPRRHHFSPGCHPANIRARDRSTLDRHRPWWSRRGLPGPRGAQRCGVLGAP